MLSILKRCENGYFHIEEEHKPVNSTESLLKVNDYQKPNISLAHFHQYKIAQVHHEQSRKLSLQSSSSFNDSIVERCGL